MADNNTTFEDQYFIPVADEESLPLPVSLVDEVETATTENPNPYHLEPLRIRWLKPFFKILGVTLLSLVGWEFIAFVYSLSQIHWSLGGLAAVLLLSLLGLLLVVLRSYRYNQQELQSVSRFRDQAQSFINGKTLGNANRFIKELEQLYLEKPQEHLLARAVASIPDYANDAEVMTHLSAHFLEVLDKKAITIVSRHAQQAGVLVAISPLAIADILLSLWRISHMIDEIGQVYGLRPSLPGRINLARQLLKAMALAGATEIMTDAISDFSSMTTAGIVSSRLGQGIGVGLYVARIGIQTTALCRPINFEPTNRIKIRDISKTLIPFIKDHIKEKQET